MLNGLAQLNANVSVQRLLRQARLSYGIWQNRCIKCIFDLRYFQFMMGLSGHNHIINRRASVLTEDEICRNKIIWEKVRY